MFSTTRWILEWVSIVSAGANCSKAMASSILVQRRTSWTGRMSRLVLSALSLALETLQEIADRGIALVRLRQYGQSMLEDVDCVRLRVEQAHR